MKIPVRNRIDENEQMIFELLNECGIIRQLANRIRCSQHQRTNQAKATEHVTHLSQSQLIHQQCLKVDKQEGVAIYAGKETQYLERNQEKYQCEKNLCSNDIGEI